MHANENYHGVVIYMDDSSEYSDEVEEDFDVPYPFHEKGPAGGDFVLVKFEP